MSSRARKQTVFSRLSAKSKYRAMDDLTCELICIHDMTEMSFVPKTPVRLYCDMSVIYIIQNPVFNERTKHIEVNERSKT